LPVKPAATHRRVAAAIGLGAFGLGLLPAIASSSVAATRVEPQGVRILHWRVEDPRGVLGEGGGAAVIHGGAEFVVDMGSDTGGTVEVDVDAASGGPLELSYSEGKRYLKPGGDLEGAHSVGRDRGPDRSFDLVADAGVFRSPRIRGGERYILVRLPRGRFVVDNIAIRPSYLVGELAGRFESSSRFLDRIWDASVDTLALDTTRAQDGSFRLIDGAKRDRLVWAGDLEMESLVGAYSWRSMPTIIGDSISMFACQQQPGGYIPMASEVDVSCSTNPGPANGPPAGVAQRLSWLSSPGALPVYTAWWVIAACDDYTLGGDAAQARRLLPVMRRAMGYFADGAPGGLFESPPGARSWRAYDPAQHLDAYTNETWAQALLTLARIEVQVGSPARARADRETARSVEALVRERFYDPAVGLFLGGDESGADHPQDANVGALLSGTVGGAEASSLLGTMGARLRSPFGPLTAESATDPDDEQFISPYMSGWELIAALQQHRGALARTMLEALWGHMARGDPGTMWEAISTDGQPQSLDRGRVYRGRTSLAHGWSTAPGYALPAYVLGMRPASPGWRHWLVEPIQMGLHWARGQVETPEGPLAVAWNMRAGEMHLQVDPPPGTSGTVVLPDGRRRRVRRAPESSPRRR
jgi:alpha-L-rhamnosidase